MPPVSKVSSNLSTACATPRPARPPHALSWAHDFIQARVAGSLVHADATTRQCTHCGVPAAHSATPAALPGAQVAQRGSMRSGASLLELKGRVWVGLITIPNASLDGFKALLVCGGRFPFFEGSVAH